MSSLHSFGNWMDGMPHRRSRYHALHVRWIYPPGCTFIVRAESEDEISGSAEHVRNGTRYAAWVPCLKGGTYTVTVYLLSNATANAADIPNEAFIPMPVPNTTRWRQAWAPRTRFLNDASPAYRNGPVNEVQAIHTETQLCLSETEHHNIGRGTAHLVGGWEKLQYRIAGSGQVCDKQVCNLQVCDKPAEHNCCCIGHRSNSTDGRRLPLPVQPPTVWSSKSVQDYACSFVPPNAPHTFRGPRPAPAPRDKRLLWRPHDPVECDSRACSALAPWTDYVGLALERAAMGRGRQARPETPPEPKWIHIAGCSTTSGLAGAFNMLFNQMNASGGKLMLGPEQKRQLFKAATHSGYLCVDFKPLLFGCNGFNVSYMNWVSKTVPGSIRGRPAHAILTELGLGDTERGPDLVVLASGLWDVQDERREQFEQSGQEARALVHLLRRWSPNTTLIWTSEPLAKLGPNVKAWRSADRMLDYGRAILSALHPLGVPYVSVSSMFAPLPSVDGRHYPMEYSMDWLSVILNVWTLAAPAVDVPRYVLP